MKLAVSVPGWDRGYKNRLTMADLYCNLALQDFTRNDCDNATPGGIDGMLLINPTAELVDPSDPVEVQALIDAGDAVLIQGPNFAGTFPEAEIQDQEQLRTGIAREARRNYTFTARTRDVNDSNINSFVPQLNGVFQKLLWHESRTGKVRFADVSAAVSAWDMTPESESEFQEIAFRITWANTTPTRHDEPAGIFV